jgi:integrase
MGFYNVEPLRTAHEISEFKSALHDLGGERDRFLFTLGINTGLRISDLIKLKVSDIYAKPYTDILEKKTEKKRRVHLLAIQGDIVEYCVDKQPDDVLFKSKKTDTHISTTQAYRILVAAGEWIGRKDIGTHTMRKTFGYHYYKRTKDVYTLMEIFGHASPSITKKYIGIREDEIADSLKDFRL